MPTSPTVVLVHGAFADSASFAAVVPPLRLPAAVPSGQDRDHRRRLRQHRHRRDQPGQHRLDQHARERPRRAAAQLRGLARAVTGRSLLEELLAERRAEVAAR